MPWSSSSSPPKRNELIRPPRSGWISISQTPPRNLMPPRIVVSRGVKSSLVFALALATLSACGPASAARLPSPLPSSHSRPAASPTPSPLPTPTPNTAHVFVLVMENRSYSQAIIVTYTPQLSTTYALSTNSTPPSPPPLPHSLPIT